MKISLPRPTFQRITVAAFLGILSVVLVTTSRESRPPATFVGQQTCITSGCHADYANSIYRGADEFKKTMHANVHNRPTPENVVIDDWFEADTLIKLRLGEVRTPPGDTLFFHLSKRGTQREYWIRMLTLGEFADSTNWMKIAYNYGGNGWLHRFLVEVNGTLQIIPFQYQYPTYKTSSDTGSVGFNDLRGWYSYNSQIDAIRFSDTNSQLFFDNSWDNKCAACHVNGFSLDEQVVNDSTKRVVANWYGSHGGDSALRDINIAVGCESCHGPGSDHVSDPRNSEYQRAISPKLWDPGEGSTIWTDRKLDLCNQCHNRHVSTQKLHRYAFDDETNTPYFPGEELKNFVNDLVNDMENWADGETSLAHHQTGQDYWRSSHYKNHVFPNGCYDCHSVHAETEYPYQLNRNWYSLTKGVGCVNFGCHANYADTEMRPEGVFNIHSQHLIEHSQCVNCHYTKTASIGKGGTITNEFSDHSERVIRPTATIQYRTGGTNFLGQPNTCAASCHRNGYGDRNAPWTFYNVTSVDTPMKAPDYGINDLIINNWREATDIELAESLWLGYQRLYADYISAVREGETSDGSAGILSVAPNPARQSVKIRFNLPEASIVRLEVYDITGKIVRTIALGEHRAGVYSDLWNLDDQVGYRVASGTYFVRLSIDESSEVRQIFVK